MNNRQVAASMEFQTVCETLNVPPTKRAASKMRLGYGRMCAASGQSSRTPPPGPRHMGWSKRTTRDESGKVTATRWTEIVADR